MILSFWQLRRSKRITSLQADLYYFLLQESSSRGEGLDWENPFECSNKLICAGIGISEDAIKDARNRLKQTGLIDFTPGERNKRAPVYELFYPFKTGNEAGNTAGNYPGKKPGNTAGKQPHIIKEYQNVTKRNESTSDANASGAVRKKIARGKSSGGKPAEPPEEHWPALVDTWYRINAEKFNGFKPDFEGQDPAHLKNIVQRLKRRALEAGKVWDQNTATDRLYQFFKYAYESDDWIRANFLLSNLRKQLEKFEKNGTHGKAGASAGKANGDTGKAGEAGGRGASIDELQRAKRGAPPADP